jgi:hypothetical protein
LGTPERKKPHGRPSCRRENIKTYLQELGYEITGRTNFVESRGHWLTAVNAVVKLRVP